MSNDNGKEFVLDFNEEKKSTFWRKVHFDVPTGDGAQRQFIRCEFETRTQAELDALLEDGGNRSNAYLLRDVLVNADVKRKGEDGKVEPAEFTEELKESLINRPYFCNAAAVVYIYAMNGAGGGGGPRERKGKN